MDVVSSPWWVDQDGMRSGERPGSGDKNELGKTKHGGGVLGKTEAVAVQRCFCYQGSGSSGGWERNPKVVDTSRQRAVAGVVNTYGIQALAATVVCDLLSHPKWAI